MAERMPAQESQEAQVQRVKRLAAELQKKASELPSARVNTALDAVTFETLALGNTLTVVDGRNYYAFRFKTPATPGDLMWSFRLAPGLLYWYICPVSGSMTGFRNFTNKRLPRDVEGVGKEGEQFVVQRLYATYLKPDTEYIIWFQFETGKPATVVCSVNVVAGQALTLSHLFPCFWGTSPSAPPG
jgi:hypothetical protein